ncbi:DUF3080 family protein [Marinobacterium litorale]|uniref:DUF3080 family protein n=1 Tax=Marinobacterium litorale TaxID=404770 RepID=UPI0003F6202D|nr:DUF3080 family protein [Marinobacterium litorale]
MLILRGLLLVTLGLLTGCSQQSEVHALLDNYADRVGNAIEHEVDLNLDLASGRIPPLPPTRARSLDVTALSEGLVDVLDFRHCGLLHTIAERNSSLGKLAPGSQRLIYEIKLLPALRQCREDLAEDNAPDLARLKARLDEVIDAKADNLGGVLWNSLYLSPEMEQHFALTGQPLPLTASSVFSSLQPALVHFEQLATLTDRHHWQAPHFIDDLEQDFESLYRSDFGAAWLQSLALITATLDSTADALEQRLAERPVCFQQKPNNQARIIRNVFQTYYAGELQPYLSLVHRQGERWRYYQLSITNALPAPQPAADYLKKLFGDSEQSLWGRYIAARDRHTRAWQTLLSQCGMMPGG